MPPESVRIGCSGWNYAHWRAVVYPKGLPPARWLEHYATLFDTVEVNSTFYRLPASRYLTHIKRLTDLGRGIERFCKHGAALVIGDHPERTFQAHELTAEWTFIRFHYGSRGRNGNYSEWELEEWAERIQDWRRRAEVFAYFNNDWHGYAVKNGLWLKERLSL